MFYLVRVMTPFIKGPVFHNYVYYAHDIVSAKQIACRLFGTESVASVECVESVFGLLAGTEYVSP